MQSFFYGKKDIKLHWNFSFFLILFFFSNVFLAKNSDNLSPNKMSAISITIMRDFFFDKVHLWVTHSYQLKTIVLYSPNQFIFVFFITWWFLEQTYGHVNIKDVAHRLAKGCYWHGDHFHFANYLQQISYHNIFSNIMFLAKIYK